MLLLSNFKATEFRPVFPFGRKPKMAFYLAENVQKLKRWWKNIFIIFSYLPLCIWWVYRRWEWLAENAGKYGNELQLSFEPPPPGHKTSIYRLTNAVSPRILFSNWLNLVFPLPKVVNSHCIPRWCLKRRSGGSDPITKPVDSIIMNFEQPNS